MLDFNLYTDYCAVFGDDKDSGKILYSFVTWQEDRLLPQMNLFKDTLFDSIKECNETASNLSLSEKRNVILFLWSFENRGSYNNIKSISVLTSTYSLLCDILFTTYQLIKSDNRVFTVFEVPLKDCTLDGAPFLIQLTMETFSQIAQLESEILSRFMLEDKLIHAFLISKLLSISISKYIIRNQFYQKIKLKRGLYCFKTTNI